MKTDQFLSTPGNRIAVRTISQRMLAEVEHDELGISTDLIEPLIATMAAGEVVTVDTSDEAGSFGGGDLVVMVVVPMVVEVLGNLLFKLGEDKIDELKKRLEHEQDAKALLTLSFDDIEVIVKSHKPGRGKREIRRLVKALNAALLEYFATGLQDTTAALGSVPAGQADLSRLRQILSTHFSESELRDLCFDLSVDYESLPGEGNSDKARELVAHLERRGRTFELLEACHRLRPNAF